MAAKADKLSSIERIGQTLALLAGGFGSEGAAGLRWNTRLHDYPALDCPEYARDRIDASWSIQQFFWPAATEPGLRPCDPMRQPALDIKRRCIWVR